MCSPAASDSTAKQDHRSCDLCCPDPSIELGNDVEYVQFVFYWDVRCAATEDKAEESILGGWVCVCCTFRLAEA